MVGRRVDANPGSLAYLAPELTTADLALPNLESPLALFPPISDSRFNLCTSSDRADLLSNWGLDLLSLANNHSFDCGPDGPLESSTILEHVWVASISPSMQPVYRRVNDLQMAFLAFDDITSPLDEDAAIQAGSSGDCLGPLGVGISSWRFGTAEIPCTPIRPGWRCTSLGSPPPCSPTRCMD
jgi:hypothetical protein